MEFSKGIKIRQKEYQPTEKEIFLDLIKTLNECWERTKTLEDKIGLGIGSYEEPLYMSIETLFFLYYGELKAMIALWWVFDRFGEKGELLPVILNKDEEGEEEVFVKTPIQLWNLLEKISKK